MSPAAPGTGEAGGRRGAGPGRAGGPWRVERLRGGAGWLHCRDVAWEERSVTSCAVRAPALVLGSTQPGDHVAPGAAVDVVRRRSGGGAVLVAPGRLAWVDVVLPAHDPLWDPDVGRAFWWLGEAWAAALGALGVSGATVHRGPLVSSPWSRLVCFAGIGPGEVRVGGRKAVGMAQRRTRAGALFQCAVPLEWDASALLDVLALPPESRAAAADALATSVHPVPGVTADDVLAALVDHLPRPR